MKSVSIYASFNDVVYPKYFVINPKDEIFSGSKEQSVHLYIGFGTPGAIWHGIIGINIEVSKPTAEAITEYITFCFNCILLYLF